MTNADTRMATDSAAATAFASIGLQPDLQVTSQAQLTDIAGPFLTADLTSGDEVVAVVAVFDDPDSQPDAVLSQVAQAASTDVGSAAVREGEPVLGGFELADRFRGPFSVAAFTDGAGVRALFLTSADRRTAGGSTGSTGAGAGASAGMGAVPAAASALANPGEGSLEKLVNVSLDVSVELGRAKVTLAEVMAFDVGSVVELDRAAGAPVDIRVNETLLAQGEVVLIDDEYAVRITAIIDPKPAS